MGRSSRKKTKTKTGPSFLSKQKILSRSKGRTRIFTSLARANADNSTAHTIEKILDQYLMSSSKSSARTTRNSAKKAYQTRANKAVADSASPSLPNRKRKASQETEQPSPKRMASDEILSAIAGIRKSVEALDTRLGNFCTRADFQVLSTDLREGLNNNTSNIQKLFELRREDNEKLSETVAKLVDERFSSCLNNSTNPLQPQCPAYEEERTLNYMKARRSIRMWPVRDSPDLTLAVRHFMTTILEIPRTVAEGIVIEEVIPQQQPRRSRITDEILVRFQSSNDRDIVQSYASKQFEAHAGNLRAVHGQLKRSIRFDDAGLSLCMDVKLDGTGWHRLNKDQIAQISKARSLAPTRLADNGKRDAELRMIMLVDAPPTNNTRDPESEDDDRGPRLRPRSSNQSSM